MKTNVARTQVAPAWVPIAYRDEFGVGYGPGWTAATVKEHLTADRRAAGRCPTCDTPWRHTARFHRRRILIVAPTLLAIGVAIGRWTR